MVSMVGTPADTEKGTYARVMLALRACKSGYAAGEELASRSRTCRRGRAYGCELRLSYGMIRARSAATAVHEEAAGERTRNVSTLTTSATKITAK